MPTFDNVLCSLARHYWEMALHDERQLLGFLTQFMVASAAIMFVGLTFLGIRASYGRYASTSFLASIFPLSVPARIAWFLQEIPSFVLPLVAMWQMNGATIPNLVVLTMFTGHYMQRSLIYPFLIKGGKPTPLHLFLLGFVFCSWNGYIQGFYHAKYANYPSHHIRSFGAIAGIALFLGGMFVNIHSDHILRNLRLPGEKCYKIPCGGMFELVSGANFLGEIVEWVGYALFAQTKTAWAFAIFTAANLIPRARAHHKWYLRHFDDDYPRDRTAIIPFLY